MNRFAIPLGVFALLVIVLAIGNQALAWTRDSSLRP